MVSCHDVKDSIIDCIDFDGPQFSLKNLPIATLNEEYRVEIVASIKNDPNDDWYNYYFEMDGSLPYGVRFERNNESRSVVIAGTPVQVGDFKFSVDVIVSEPDSDRDDQYDDDDSYDDGDTLCTDYNRRKFTLTVQAFDV